MKHFQYPLKFKIPNTQIHITYSRKISKINITMKMHKLREIHKNVK